MNKINCISKYKMNNLWLRVTQLQRDKASIANFTCFHVSFWWILTIPFDWKVKEGAYTWIEDPFIRIAGFRKKNPSRDHKH